ncbi:hypothetical protein TIFTF001_024864 [Ficus carica]|uniref:Uncharacterized protein n=1 Tax=Ficus carica TaxID=3494 RepID=A0AA88AP11_FICCA|nr:hypothetical protein TIFTF001_024864 [Ficus carica]
MSSTLLRPYRRGGGGETQIEDWGGRDLVRGLRGQLSHEASKFMIRR